MKKHRNMELSDMICPDCGKKFPVWRISGQAREKGHIKDIWCPFCKQDKHMLEIRSRDFVLECR